MTSQEISIKIGVLIPTYNHIRTLPEVIEGAKAEIESLIVVDDGSTDGTSELLRRYEDDESIEIVRLPENRGKGFALLSGLKRAHELGWTHAISMDADGQHDSKDIPKFVAAIEEEPDALIVGSRPFKRKKNVPLKSRMGRGFSNFWLRVIAGQPLPDSQSGFRAYPVEHILQLGCRTRRYEFEVEVLVRASWAGMPLKSVPIDVYYPPEGERISHFRPLPDFMRISLLNTFLFFRLLSPWPKRKVRLFSQAGQKRSWKEEWQLFWNGGIDSLPQSNAELAIAIGFGVFMGIIPIWGYQMLVALYFAHFFRLNKWVVLLASNISFGPMPIPITMLSLWIGHFLLTGQMTGAFWGDFSSWQSILFFARKSFAAWILGGVTLALVAGLLFGVLAYFILKVIRQTERSEQGEQG